MTAPTEEDVRAAVARAWTLKRNPVVLMAAPETALDDMLSGLRGLTDHLHDFDDMRQSEIDRMDAIYDEEFAEVDAAADHLRKTALEATVRAERRFFEEHPDSPWNKPQPITA